MVLKLEIRRRLYRLLSIGLEKIKRKTSADDTQKKQRRYISMSMRAWRVTTRYNDATPTSPGYKAYARWQHKTHFDILFSLELTVLVLFYFFQFFYGCRRDLLRPSFDVVVVVLCCAVSLSGPREIVIYLVYLLRCFFSLFFFGFSLLFDVVQNSAGRVNHSSLFCSVWVDVVYCVCVCLVQSRHPRIVSSPSFLHIHLRPPYFLFSFFLSYTFPFPFDSLILLFVFFSPSWLPCQPVRIKSARITLHFFLFYFFRFIYWCTQFLFFF